MPGRPRLVLPGTPLHLIQRGNNRQACFYADSDYQFELKVTPISRFVSTGRKKAK
jgi:putative transposase